MLYSSFRGIKAITTGLTSPLQPLDKYCSGCTLAKAVAVISRNQPEKTTKKLGHVWIDWWGPFGTPSLEGYTNMLTLTDKASRKI
jgi:hypothetical protein